MNIDRGIADEVLARAREPREVACWSRTKLPARLIRADAGWHAQIHGHRCLVTDVEHHHDASRDAGSAWRITGSSIVNGREHAASFGAQTWTTIWRPLYPGDAVYVADAELFAPPRFGMLEMPERGVVRVVFRDGSERNWSVADGDDPSSDITPNSWAARRI